MSRDPANYDSVRGSGSVDFGPFAPAAEAPEKCNIERAGKPDSGALEAFGGIDSARKNNSLTEMGTPDIDKPGYPIKGSGTSDEDNGVRGRMGGDDKPETSGHSRHYSS